VVRVISSEVQGPTGQRSYRELERGQQGRIEVPGAAEARPGLPLEPARPLKPGFLELMKGFVGDVNGLQLQAGKTIDAFAAGEVTDVHQVMVAIEEAGVALDLLLEVRNRTMEAYQDIMRMQV
jgi:flagellar hook-basal body complex protein FliE